MEKTVNIFRHQRNANGNCFDIPSHPICWLSLRKQKSTDSGQGVGKEEPFFPAGGDGGNGIATMEISLSKN